MLLRPFAVVLLLGAVAAADSWTMPADERAALMAVVERAIAAGLPDARGGSWHRGDLVLAWKADGDERSETVDGLHLKLADGGWLVGGTVRLHADVRVDAAALPRVVPEGLLAWALAEQDDDFADLVSGAGAADRPRLAASRDALALADWCADRDASMSFLALHLLRQGVPGAERLAVALAAFMRYPSDRRFAQGAPQVLALGDSAWDDADEEILEGEPLPPPATALRQGLIHRLLDGGLDDEPLLPASARALAAPALCAQALALCDAGEGMRALVALAAGRAALPVQAPAGADLAARLASWDGDQQVTRRILVAALDDALPPATRALVGPLRRTFTAADADRLLALLDHDGPCRWVDRGRPRRLGDAALRALAGVLGFDPRLAVGRDPAAPWSDDERRAVIAAVRAWWADAAAGDLAARRRAVVDRLDLAGLAELLATAEAGELPALLDAVAAHWSAHSRAQPPRGAPQQLAAVLAAGRGHAALKSVVDGWPVAGEAEVVLAAWRQVHGDGAAVDGLLAHLAAFPERDDVPGAADLLPVVAAAPTPARLRRLLDLAVGDGDGEGFAPLLRLGVLPWRGGDADALLAPARGEAGASARLTLPLALLVRLAGDQRALPEDHADQALAAAQLAERAKAADDLRVADLAGAFLAKACAGGALPAALPEPRRAAVAALAIDLAAAKPARDARLAALVAAAEEAAGVKDLLAAVAAPAPAAPVFTTAADRAALAALVDRALALGVPDARAGRWFTGTLVLTWQDAGTQRSADVAGLHLKLADGGWAVLGAWRPQAGVGVADAEVKPCDPSTWRQLAAVVEPDRDFPGIGAMDAPGRVRALAAYADWRLFDWVLEHDLRPGLAIVHLLRQGGADTVALAEALAEALAVNDFARLTHVWHGRYAARLRLIEPRWIDEDQRTAWTGSIPTPTPPAVALRRNLHYHFLDHLERDPWTGGAPARLLDATAAAAAAQAMVDAASEPAMKRLVALAAGRRALPDTAAAGADLPTRLAAWDGSADLALPPSALPDLLALAGDERPCRWIDDEQTRCLGDAALRAATQALGIDVRLLVGRDVLAAWTAAERAATVAALAAWSRSEAARSPLAAVAALVPALDRDQQANLVDRRVAAPWIARAAALDAIAAAWSKRHAATAPGDRMRAFGAIVGASAGHPAMDALIASWPLTGVPAPVLAAWHQRRGDGAPVLGLAQRILAGGEDGDDGCEFGWLLPVLAHAPDRERLALLRQVLARPLDDDHRVSLVHWLGRVRVRLVAVDPVLDPVDAATARRRLALPLYALRQLLDDRRALPDGLARLRDSLADDLDVKPADDLRLCDLAALILLRCCRDRPHDLEPVLPAAACAAAAKLPFAAGAAAGDRDGQLPGLRAVCDQALKAAMAAAGLDAAAGDGGVLF